MSLRARSREYNGKQDLLASLSLGGNFVVYFAALYLSIRAAQAQAWWVFAPALLITSFSGVRLYVLQHDCGHNSLYSKKKYNDWAGLTLQTFAVTPFKVMQYNHNLHHAHVGNLAERDKGEILTMTLSEWNEASAGRRLYYRIYRNPFVLIPLGAFWTYFIAYRWPKNTRKVGAGGVLLHDLLVLAYAGAIWLAFGWTGLWVHVASVFVAGCLGVFLVYLQHNFEDTWWDRKPELDFTKAAVQGSSCLDFGWVFDEAVANITKHDIHHLNSNIPSYRLRECHREMADEFQLRRIGFGEALMAFRLKLWDEEAKRLVPFPRAGEKATAAHPAE